MSKWMKIGQGKLTPVSGAGITDVQPVSPMGDHIDTDKPIRLGFWVLVIGFGGFLLWSALARLALMLYKQTIACV